MRKKNIIVKIFLAIPILLLAAAVLPCPAATQKLTIVFSGDMRGELENCHCPKEDYGGLPRRGNYIDQVRHEVKDLLLIDAGDVLPLVSSDVDRKKISYDAFISLKAMDMMRYSVMNVGESDLILGEAFLKQKEAGVSFPFISANIVDKHTGETFFKPYVIKEMENGLKVGILGLVNERYVINSDKLTILPNKEAASKFIPELKQMSDIVIALGHVGLPYSIELANSVEGIDVILSGHWDTSSQEPMKIGNTLIMPTTYHSRKIGRLGLEIENGRIYSYEWESTPLDKNYDGNIVMENLISSMPDIEKTKKEIMPEIDQVQERPLRVFVFYAPGCRSCMEVNRDILPDIEARYGSDIAVEHYDVSVLKNYEQMVRLERLHGIEEGGGYVPEVIVSRYVLMGKEEISNKLDKTIQKALEELSEVKKNENIISPAAEYHPPEGSLILSRFQSFSLYAVITAGLLDGVNPCAFTTIVFFISFLAFAGYKKREMFFACSSFIIAVFLAYLLIGVGIFRFLKALKAFDYAADTINIGIGGLAILLGVLSLVDYFKFKKNRDTKGIILQLPRSIKNKIQSIIGSDFRVRQNDTRKTILKIVCVAFTAGFMVSVLESFCTGQVYLPTIAFVLRLPEKKMSALLYLVLYNLAFIMPLIAVFLLGFFGATSKTFSMFIERRLGIVKISTAALFFTLGAALIIFR